MMMMMTMDGYNCTLTLDDDYHDDGDDDFTGQRPYLDTIFLIECFYF